jgi:hypothetical protein
MQEVIRRFLVVGKVQGVFFRQSARIPDTASDRPVLAGASEGGFEIAAPRKRLGCVLAGSGIP